MTFNFEDYQKPSQPQSGLSVPTEKVEPISPVSVVIGGIVILALAGSFATSVPGMMNQYNKNAAVKARLAQDGLQELSEEEALKALKTAKPLVDPNTLDLVLVGWEQVINSPKFPAGTYFTSNAVIIKKLNGAGRAGDTGEVAGHGFANIPPEKAEERFAQFKENLKKIEVQK